MNATRRQIVSSLPVYLLFGVVAAPTAGGQATAKTVHVEQALAAPNETKPASFFWGDYDGDGFDDFFAIAPDGQGQLLRNRADGTFEVTTMDAGLSDLVSPTFDCMTYSALCAISPRRIYKSNAKLHPIIDDASRMLLIVSVGHA